MNQSKIIKSKKRKNKNRKVHYYSDSSSDSPDSQSDEDEVENDRKTSNIVKSDEKMFDFMENGLVDGLNYYEKSSENDLIVGKYHFNTDKMVGIQHYCLTMRQFQYLMKPEKWLHGQIIDIYTGSYMDNWINCTYVPTDISIVLHHDVGQRPNRMMTAYNIKEDLSELILFPYNYLSHWRLLVVDTKNKTLELIDPLEKGIDEQRVVTAFKNYIKYSDDRSTLKKLKDCSWVTVPSRPRPYQFDTWNCGVYVTYYIECITKNIATEKEFNPEKYSQKDTNKVNVYERYMYILFKKCR